MWFSPLILTQFNMLVAAIPFWLPLFCVCPPFIPLRVAVASKIGMATFPDDVALIDLALCFSSRTRWQHAVRFILKPIGLWVTCYLKWPVNGWMMQWWYFIFVTLNVEPGGGKHCKSSIHSCYSNEKKLVVFFMDFWQSNTKNKQTIKKRNCSPIWKQQTFKVF